MNNTKPLQIKVLGSATSGQQMIISLIEKSLNKAELPHEIEEVTDISSLIESKLESVPAIQVNSDTYFLNNNGRFNQSFRKALSEILQKAEFGLWPKVLVPIDLSDVSKNASIYAQQLLSELSMVAEMMHVYTPNAKQIIDHNDTNDHKDPEQISLDEFNQFVDNIDTDWGSDLLSSSLIDRRFKVGFAADEILASAQKFQVKFIVMGTTGNQTKLKRWLGSVSTTVLQQSTKPVLLVPQNVRYQKIKHISYAFHDTIQDLKTLEQLIDIVNTFKCKLSLISVNNEDDAAGENLKAILGEKLEDCDIRVSYISGDQVTTDLLKEAQLQNAQILVCSSRQKSPIQRLINGSISIDLSIETDMPLMIL